MLQPRRPSAGSLLGFLVLIVVVIGGGAATFAYTAGWLSPERLTPTKMVAAFTPPGGRAARPSPEPCQGHLLHRRLRSEWRRIGALAGPRSSLAASIRLSGASISAPPIRTRRMRRFACGAWDCGFRRRTGRSGAAAMINPPVFPVSTPQGFYELLHASGSKDPDAMKTFVAAHPEFAALRRMGHEGRPGPAAMRRNATTASTASSSPTVPARIMRCAGRCCRRRSRLPISPEDLAKRGPDVLEQEITERVRSGPQRWTMVVTVANPGDPTADPTKAWPADRRTVEVGTLIVQKIEAERGRPLPRHQLRSDRPAGRHPDIGRSRSRRPGRPPMRGHMTFARREAKDYPRTATDAQP